jgi:uncharacterized protein
MMRHWNTIAGTLFKDDVYVPLLLEDENGVTLGNDWARGFVRGMHMCHNGWAGLFNDEEHGGCVIPMMALYHEHDEDPEMRPEPISPENREEIIVHMAAGLMAAYRYFRAQRAAYADMSTPEPRRSTPKLGRNDPCPCGSGNKTASGDQLNGQRLLRRGGGGAAGPGAKQNAPTRITWGAADPPRPHDGAAGWPKKPAAPRNHGSRPDCRPAAEIAADRGPEAIRTSRFLRRPAASLDLSGRFPLLRCNRGRRCKPWSSQ